MSRRLDCPPDSDVSGPVKVVSLSAFLQPEKEAKFSFLLASHFSRNMFVFHPPYVSPSTPSCSFLPLDVSFLSLTRNISLSPASPGAFILAGCFLYETTPMGRQAPLSDTIHCTCIDMKSVLTSPTEFRGAAETAYEWQCTFCDQIKEVWR